MPLNDVLKKGQNRYITKKQLYDTVTELMSDCGISTDIAGYRVDAIALAPKVCINLEMKHLDFESTLLCGILYKSKKSTSIALNNRRTDKGKNFDCMHELMHYWLHDTPQFYCYEKTRSYFEWQANEGAAQFLMPYQIFIPKYAKAADTYYSTYAPDVALSKLTKSFSDQFNVTEQSVLFRINSLKHEIAQYESGVRIEDIAVIAKGKSNLQRLKPV